MNDIFDLESLLPLTITAFGLAMVAGNGWAMIQHRRGNAPEGFEARYRPARARWLLTVGALISIWGLVSLFG